MKHWITLAITLAALTLAGCAVDAQAPSEPAVETVDSVEATIVTYDLSKKGPDGKNLFTERTVRMPRIPAALEGDELGKARQALLQNFGCQTPYDVGHNLVVWHGPNFSSNPYTCFKNTGEIDLTTAYFVSNPDGQCAWQSEPYRTQCYNYLRVSGNVGSLWNYADGVSACLFLGPGFSTYTFNHGPTAPYLSTYNPPNLVNATYLVCW